MFALYRLRYAHWARNINTHNNWWICRGRTAFLIMNLGRCLNNIVDIFALWHFFILYFNIIFMIAKLTLPYLLFFALFQYLWLFVKYRFTISTGIWISCCYLNSWVLNTSHADLEYIGINLLFMNLCLSSPCSLLLHLRLGRWRWFISSENSVCHSTHKTTWRLGLLLLLLGLALLSQLRSLMSRLCLEWIDLISLWDHLQLVE